MVVRAPTLLALCAALGLAAWLGQSTAAELTTKRNLHDSSYVTAAQCARCHPDHARSFQRTFHRTMTQRASAQSVRGNFDGASLDYFGVRAHMERTPGGEHVLRYQLQNTPEQRFIIEKTVGSRRYQQYIARRGDELVRLPVAYHIEEQRWFHMNGAFLTPDPAHDAPLSQSDYERHITRWNDNCIFCHNVAPNPGLSKTGAKTSFNTEVAELGIACEACHGPGSAHEQANTNPARRYALALGDSADPTIVNPARLSPERSLDVCGRCHGQRITDDVNSFLTHGDPFVPGDDLALYSAPLWRDTTLHGEAAFEPRFWRDGTPRLTAYEYQGTLLSPCAQRGSLTCLSCHGMHEGDPRGQIRPSKQGAAMCTQCHERLRPIEAQRTHAKHDPTRTQCVDCHMPNVVYGVLSVHPSHRIELPDPAHDARANRPDACTLCHTDKSREWAHQQHHKLWPNARIGDAPATTQLSEVEQQLFAGDPIQRAIAASAFGNPQTPTNPRKTALLLDVLEHDPYPAIRHLALRSLRALQPDLPLDAYVPEATPGQRTNTLRSARERFPLNENETTLLRTLRSQAAEQAIEIGE